MAPVERQRGVWPAGPRGLQVRVATAADRETIYRLRHDVYAVELGQHPVNEARRLTDSLDAFNVYLVAAVRDEIVGFVSVTPPTRDRFSIDKYIDRADLPWAIDDRTFEVRILTVVKSHRGTPIAAILMYAALNWIESRGGERIVLIGRSELVDVCQRAGMSVLGRQIRSGKVTFELMAGTVAEARQRAVRYEPAMRRLAPLIDWQLDVPPPRQVAAVHGGESMRAIGGDLTALDRHHEVVPADVLDAWFPPAPGVSAALRSDLDWIIRTSPPIDADGLVQAISRSRGIDPRRILVGAGLSSLIFLAFQRWLTSSSTALIPDPSYGEYEHVIGNLIGGRVLRVQLDPDDDFQIDVDRIAESARSGVDLVVIVNPNNPTGQALTADQVALLANELPATTRLWIDETYADYAGEGHTVERVLEGAPNVVIAKSMSKAYALSGLRIAYLVLDPAAADDLRRFGPPWAIGMPAQLGAIAALAEPDYYRERFRQTAALRERLRDRLEAIGDTSVVPSQTNFLLVRLPADAPDADDVVRQCAQEGLHLRGFPEHRRMSRLVRITVRSEAENDRLVEAYARATTPSARHVADHPGDT